MILTVFDIVLLIALALIFARILGYVFDRFKQPAVIGEIIAGIVLGGIGLKVFFGQTISFLNFTFQLPQLNFTSQEFTFLAGIGIVKDHFGHWKWRLYRILIIIPGVLIGLTFFESVIYAKGTILAFGVPILAVGLILWWRRRKGQ